MIATVKFEIEPPEECTKEQFEEWLRYGLGLTNEIEISNPLHVYDLEINEQGSLELLEVDS